MMTCHSGAPQSGEPGIHNHSRRGYGFRVPRFARPRNDGLCFLALLLSLLVAAPAHAADDVESFYRGKQIRFIVGSAPGGTYDLLARIVARHIGAHIPGNPSIIVQNQPTAGGLLMVNQLYALGPNDGTAIGVPLNGIPAAPLLQPAAAHFDAAKLIWLGSTHSEPYVAYVWHTAPVQNLAERDEQTARGRRHHARHHHERFPAADQRHSRHQIQDRAGLRLDAANERGAGARRGRGRRRLRLVRAQRAGAAMGDAEADHTDRPVRRHAASALARRAADARPRQDRTPTARRCCCCSAAPNTAGPISCRPTCRRSGSRRCAAPSTPP